MSDYIIQNGELCHYGVKGMKWGVRKAQKKEYGLSRGQLKRRIKDAKTNYRRNDNPLHTFGNTTGKNWATVDSARRKAMADDTETKDLKSKRDSAYKKAEAYDRKGDYDNSNKYQDIGDTYADKLRTREKEIGKQYANAYADALLKDIGYSDVNKGRKMLKAYGIEIRQSKFTNDYVIR